MWLIFRVLPGKSVPRAAQAIAYYHKGDITSTKNADGLVTGLAPRLTPAS
jgi:hypothetical protein